MNKADSSVKITRAEFVNKKQARIGGKTEEEVLQGLRSKNDGNKKSSNSNLVKNDYLGSSPLLTSTPPTVSKVLINLYPYLIIWDSLLGVLTWTCDDIWPSVLMVFTYFGLVLYLNTIVKYFGHLIIISIFIGYAKLDKYIEKIVTSKPTLENIVIIMDRISLKSDILLTPFTNLNMKNIQRILLTALVLSPIHILISWLILPPQKLLLLGGLFVLTYHSPWSKVTRRLFWKFRFVRLAIFYITGIDLGGINKGKDKGIFAAVQKQVSKLASAENENKHGVSDDKPIRFTYVLYENQRRWLGIGWKASLLSYERTPWTDEFLNEAPAPENFQLPDENFGMQWRWVDKTWRLDLTNDAAINLSETQAKTTANPGTEEGFLYYDNQWKKPSIDETFSKYTRRRRWVRTAELIKTSADVKNSAVTSKDISGNSKLKETEETANTQPVIKEAPISTIKKTTTNASATEYIPMDDVKDKDSKSYEKEKMTSVRNRIPVASSSSNNKNGIRYIDD